jgi:hypothetical protein
MSAPVIGVYLLGIVLFAAAFAAARLSKNFGEVTSATKSALSAIRDPTLDDDAKGRVARRASWSLLRQGVEILVKGTLSIASALLPFWVADTFGLAPWNETLEFASRWDVLGFTTVVIFAIWFVRRRRAARLRT